MFVVWYLCFDAGFDLRDDGFVVLGVCGIVYGLWEFSFKGFSLDFLVVLILSMLTILVVRWWSSWMFGVGGLGLFVGFAVVDNSLGLCCLILLGFCILT